MPVSHSSPSLPAYIDAPMHALLAEEDEGEERHVRWPVMEGSGEPPMKLADRGDLLSRETKGMREER